MTSLTEESKESIFAEPSDQNAYEKYAKSILKDALRLKPGENLTIEAWEHDLDFAKEIKLQARKLGANAVLITEDDKNYFRLAEGGSEKSLGKVGEHEWALLENSDAYVFFPGPSDMQRHLKLDAKKRAAAQAYNSEWYRRASRAGVRGARIRTAYATPSRGDMYSIDPKQWYANTLEAIDVDYSQIEKRGKKLASLFRNAKEIRITAPNGTDLRLQMSRVSPHVYSGLLPGPLKYTPYSNIANIPGSELDIVPSPTRADGKLLFDLPSYQTGGNIEGLSWTFHKGRLTASSASKNHELFSVEYKKAKGDKDRIGVVLVGLTPKLRYGSTNDMHVEGAVSIGIGSLGEGDKNKTDYSFIATISNATVELDGKKVLVDGRLA
jgi:leucyl aminopeptidase (aminopeptidase T)